MDVGDDVYSALEPTFDGSLVYISALKDSLCPGSFVFYVGGDGDVNVGRIICQAHPSAVKLNLFRSTLPEDSIAALMHVFTPGCSEVIQTAAMAVISEKAVCGCCFVFSDVDVMMNGVEVTGMRLVRLLRGWETAIGVEAVFVSSFPCQCLGFFDIYTIRSDLCYVIWHDVIQCGISLLMKCLFRSALAQGTEFCSKQSPTVAFDHWKWDWLVKELLFSFGGPLMIHNFRRCKKRVTLRKGGLVTAISDGVNQSWIRFQTPNELNALKCVFGSWCLFGIRDKPPRVGTSNVILNTTLCNVVPMMSGVQHDISLRLRTHQFGVDLRF
jgi:hypothetical protein